MTGAATGGEVGAALLEKRMIDTFGVGHHEYNRSNVGRVQLGHLNNAIRIVENSGVLEQLAKWDREARKSAAGAKPVIPRAAILVLFLLNTQMGYGVTYHEIARTLELRFGPEEFNRLGIRNKGVNHNEWYQLVWAAANRMLALVDPHPARRNHIMSAEEHTLWLANANTDNAREESERKLDRINWLCKSLVTASVKVLPKDIWNRYQGNFAGDATKIVIAGSPNSADLTQRRSNPDPSSGRYRREGSHGGIGATTDDAAYELEKAVMVWNKPGEKTLFPSLCIAVSFHTPGKIIGHAVYLTKTVQQEYGFGRILTLWDRAYNYGKIENFALPMRKLGAELVVDYQAKDTGVKGHFGDLIMLDGNLHVNWMPQKLINATTDLEILRSDVSSARDTLYKLTTRKADLTPEQVHTHDDAKATIADAPAKEAELRKRIARRDQYRMIPKGTPDADGYQRFTYPVAENDLTGRANTSRKSITVPPLIPQGDSKITDKPQPIKFQQKFTHESETWTAYYGMRSLVEASNNLVKLASAEDLGNPKKRSGRGFAFHYLASALAVVSSNLRRIITFFESEAARTRKPIKRIRRRKNEHGEALARSNERLSVPAAAP